MTQPSGSVDGLTIGDGRASVQDLVAVHDVMAIPHFQRGLVWDTGSVALLLESLFHKTPCGSIILWTPPTIIPDEGVALTLNAAPHYLIIDGQQRIRSLNGVFSDANEERPVSEPEEGGDASETLIEQDVDDSGDGADRDRMWCLNLGHLPEFANDFPVTRRFQLFRYVRDPRFEIPGVAQKDRAALLPLRWFLERDDASLAQDPEPAYSRAVKAVLDSGVSTRLREMCTHPVFDVRILGAGHSRADVVDIYNRINSAGKRVEAEEKAFANVSLFEPSINSSLRQFFDTAAHPSKTTKGSAGASGIDRDGPVRRERENRFGFKLFMRATVMSLAYHADRSLGSQAFSFDSASVATLEKGRTHLHEIIAHAADALAGVSTLLQGPLYCDDFRMLPDTSSLWPVFYLFLRFPGLLPHATAPLSSLTLRLVLADLDKRDLLQLCKHVSDAQSLDRALAHFDAHPRLTPAGIAKAVRAGVNDAQALNSRYTLLLYWLLRSKQAADFCYDVNKCDAPRLRALCRVPSPGQPHISASVQPEKQHLVPRSQLKKVFGLNGPLQGRHPANSIGNITYISAGLNSFNKGGVGSTCLNLRAEPESNRVAHFLPPSLLASYETANAQLVMPKEAKAAYETFSRKRGALIAEALIAWEESLRAGWTSGPEGDPRRRLISPGLDDRIRAVGFPPDVTARLVHLVHLSGVRESHVRDDEVVLSFAAKVKSSGGGHSQLFRLDVAQDAKWLGLKLSGELTGRLALDLPAVVVSQKKGSGRVRIREESQMVQALDWLAANYRPS